MSSPTDTVPRSILARVMFVELDGATAAAWTDELEREDIIVLSMARVIEAAAKVSPELVHVVVVSDTMASQARAVLSEAAREVGAEVIGLPLTTSAEAATTAILEAIRRVKQRRKSP